MARKLGVSCSYVAHISVKNDRLQTLAIQKPLYPPHWEAGAGGHGSEEPQLWAPKMKGGAHVHGCLVQMAFLEPGPSRHFRGPAFPLTAIFVISLGTIKCLITLFLIQNSLLITDHNFKDQGVHVSLTRAHVY